MGMPDPDELRRDVRCRDEDLKAVDDNYVGKISCLNKSSKKRSYFEVSMTKTGNSWTVLSLKAINVR